MAIALLFEKQLAQIDSLILDASVSESHAVDVQVTDHPVEQGVDISDHRRRKPRQLTIEGIVSNTPLPKPSDPNVQVTGVNGTSWVSRSAGMSMDSTPAKSAYTTLLELADSSALITVITGLETYQNMTLTSLNIPRDASIGQALQFTATLREIKIVRNDTVTVSAKTTRAIKKKDLNTKTKADAKVDNRTTALIIQEDGVQAAVKNLTQRFLGGGG